MKSFIIKTCVFGILVLMFGFIIVFTASHYSKKVDWKLPTEKHILFMGASHIQRAVNDSTMSSAINLARSSERYMFTYLKLQRILDYNQQVDTVFLMCAPTDLFENADDKYFKNEMVSFFANFYPLFHLKQWKIYGKKPLTAFGLLFRPTVVQYIKGVDYKFFIDGFNPTTDVMNTDSVYYQPITGKYGNKINYEYLRKIISLCDEKGIKLFFIYCPVYKPECYYDQDYYYNAYNTNFSDIELFDYSHFPMPEDGFVDAHHLNYYGATLFTKELKRRFGIK
jgi:hypothetical protein